MSNALKSLSKKIERERQEKDKEALREAREAAQVEKPEAGLTLEQQQLHWLNSIVKNQQELNQARELIRKLKVKVRWLGFGHDEMVGELIQVEQKLLLQQQQRQQAEVESSNQPLKPDEAPPAVEEK